MSFDNIKSVAEEIGFLSSEIKRLTARKKQLEEELRPALSGRGPVIFGHYSIEVREMPGRMSLDKEALADAGIDLDQFQKRGKPYTTLTVKEVNVA